MVKFLAFFLTFFTFGLIMESPIEQYVPNPVKEYFEIPDGMAYEYSYILSVAIPEEDFTWDDPDGMYSLEDITIAEATSILSGIEGFMQISDYEYLYTLEDIDIYVLLDAFEPDLKEEGKIEYIDFHIYEGQLGYIEGVFNISEQIADNIKGAKILDYQMETFITSDHIDEVKSTAEEWFYLGY